MGSTGGWNRPSANQPTAKKGGAKAPNLGKGILAGLVVCVLALGVMYFLRDAEKPAAKKAEKKPTAIKEVTPAPAPVAVSDAPAVKKTRVQLHRERGCYTNEYGYVFNKPTSKHVITNDTANAYKSLADEIFRNSADRKIGNLLLIPPGTAIVGSLPKNFYGPAFVKSFLKSIEAPELVSHADSPEVAELKRAVLDAKIELKARYDAGEDIGAIMANEHNELQNLGLYRNELEAEVRKLAHRSDLTMADMEDFVAAANKMLTDRGAEPMKMPRMALLRFQLAESEAQSGEDEKGAATENGMNNN